MSATSLVRYDALCRAMAEARSVDEVKSVHDMAVAMAAYARQAKNRSLEADAVVVRMRATRELDRLRQSQKETVGLATGGEHGGRRSKDGVRNTPAILRPTLAMQGIDKNLAKQARTLGALSDEKFEAVIADVHDKMERAVRNAVREIDIEQERETYRARTYEGCTVDDLESLVRKIGFGILCSDFPWPFETWSPKGKQRSAERYYETWPIKRILKFAPLLGQLAADDCALFLWVVWSQLPAALDVIKAAGFDYKTVGFVWVKTLAGVECVTRDGEGLHLGTGLSGPRANTEVCLLAKRGEPRRLAADVDQVVIAPAGEHSAKPDEVYKRIERLFPGPRLELFARRPREHWMCWGDEVSRGSMTMPEAPKLSAGSTQAAAPDPLAGSVPAAAPDPLADIPEFLLRGSVKAGV